MEITTTSGTLRTFHPFLDLPPELRRMIWHYAFSNTYPYRRMRKVNTRRLRFHLKSMHIPYENMPHTFEPAPCRNQGIGVCYVGEDGQERGVYFRRGDTVPPRRGGYTPLGGMPALLHSCREGRRVVLEEWKRIVRVKYETEDEYTMHIGSEDWRSHNRVLYERHVAIIDGLLEDIRRAEEGSGLWSGLSMWTGTKKEGWRGSE